MPVASCVDDDGQRPAFEVTWPTLSEVADRQCNDYKPRTGETSYRCVIREGWVVLLQPTGDGRPTRGDRDSYSLCGVVPPQHHHAELMVREVTRVEPAGRLLMSGPIDGAATGFADLRDFFCRGGVGRGRCVRGKGAREAARPGASAGAGSNFANELRGAPVDPSTS